MIPSIEGDNLVLQCDGIELVRMKTKVQKRIGNNSLVHKKNKLVLPLTAAHLIQDILPDEFINSNNQIKRHLSAVGGHKDARLIALQRVIEPNPDDLPEYWRKILDPGQLPAVSSMTTPELMGLCLFDEQGSGKTVMATAAFSILQSNESVDAAVIVCPKSMIDVWRDEINQFAPIELKIVIPQGTETNRADAALSDFDVLITNYESIPNLIVPLKSASSYRKLLLVADESYYVKNEHSQRSQYLGQLRPHCEKCFVLCGTPAPNSPADIVNQFNLADNGFTFSGYSESSDCNNDRQRIGQLIESRGTYIRRLKTDILSDVPSKNFHIERVPLSGRQAVLYEKARSDLELELRSLDNSTFKKYLATYFQRRSVLLQLCSNPKKIDPSMSDLPVKHSFLDSKLNDLTGKGRKIVVWSYYTNDIDELMKRYARYNPVRIDGTVSSLDRKDAVDRFQNDSKVKLFIGNPAAAGAGITLHASSDAIYMSYSSQTAHYLQSIDRIHRRGQESKEVDYYLVVCKDTIEETEIARLRTKEIQQHRLLNDHIQWPTSLDDALDELRWGK